MPMPLDTDACLKQAGRYIDMAKAAATAKLRNQYLELAKHYTELAGAIQSSAELQSEPDRPEDG